MEVYPVMKPNRKFLTRVLALVLIMILGLSFTACFAKFFKASGAGIKYHKTFKLGKTTTAKTMKKALGKYTRKTYDGCTCGVASYMYTFKSKGVKIETLKRTAKSKEEIISIIITKKGVPTIGGLRVGDKVSKIPKVYGKKCKKSGKTYTYTSGSLTLIISTKSGRVKKITMTKDV